MPKIKNVSGEDRTVASLDGRLVLAGAVVEVEKDQIEQFLCQPVNWAGVKPTPPPKPAEPEPPTESATPVAVDNTPEG